MPNLFALMSDGTDHSILLSPLGAGYSFPLEAMEETGKSKTGEARRKALIARADARASSTGSHCRGATARRDNIVVQHRDGA
jgi:hypothetical protein